MDLICGIEGVNSMVIDADGLQFYGLSGAHLNSDSGASLCPTIFCKDTDVYTLSVLQRHF